MADEEGGTDSFMNWVGEWKPWQRGLSTVRCVDTGNDAPLNSPWQGRLATKLFDSHFSGWPVVLLLPSS